MVNDASQVLSTGWLDFGHITSIISPIYPQAEVRSLPCNIASGAVYAR